MSYESFGGPVRVVTVPDPTPEPGGVVVRVRRSGLCRSDWHGWSGHDSDTVLPCIPGHEFTGTVVAPQDSAYLGARVTVPFVMACGGCPECRAGAAQVCRRQRQPGFSDPGSFAEYVAVPHAAVNLVLLPEEIGDEDAAALGCRVGTAWRAVTGVAELSAGQSIAVLGCGGVGLSAVEIAVGLGADVLAVDVDEGALRAARELGADAALLPRDPSTSDVEGAIRDFRGHGVEVTLEAIGSSAIAAGAILGLGRRGRHVQVGLPGEPRTALPLGRVIAHELRVLGSHGMAAKDYPGLLEAVSTGRLRPARQIREHLGLAEAAAALMTMDAPGAGGIRLIDPSVD